MVELIEMLENEYNNVRNEKLIEGLACIHLCINMAASGNEELLNLLDNG